MKKLNKPFVYVEVENKNGKKETQIMSLQAPHFVGRIRKFTHREEGVERLNVFLENTDHKFIGKAKGYRVYTYITQCVDDFDEYTDISGNILQSVASEMASFYLNEHLKPEKQALYRD